MNAKIVEKEKEMSKEQGQKQKFKDLYEKYQDQVV